MLKLKIDGRGNILDYEMSFQLHGEPFTISPEIFAKWLECNYNGMLNAPSTFTLNTLWIDLGDGEVYLSHTLKLTELGNSVYKVLHHIISYTLNTR